MGYEYWFEFALLVDDCGLDCNFRPCCFSVLTGSMTRLVQNDPVGNGTFKKGCAVDVIVDEDIVVDASLLSFLSSPPDESLSFVVSNIVVVVDPDVSWELF